MKRIVITGIGKQVPSNYQDKMQVNSTDYQEIRVEDEVFKVLDRKTRKRIDRYIQLGILVATKAVEDAGIATYGDCDHKSIIAASTFGSVATMSEEIPTYYEVGQVSPLLIPKVVMNMFAGNLAIQFGTKGVNYTIGTGLNAALDAIIEGVELLEEGRAESVLVCASDSCLGDYGKKLFTAYKSNPLYESANLYIEGSAALVLEPLESAQARGAHIYGEIVNYKDCYKNSDDKTLRFKHLLGCTAIQGDLKVCGYGKQEEETFYIMKSTDNFFGTTHPMLLVNEVLERKSKEVLEDITFYSMNAEGINSMITIK